MEGNMKIPHIILLFLANVAFVFSCISTADAVRTDSKQEFEHDWKGLILASTSETGTECSAPVPVLTGAVPGDGKITITWNDEHTGNLSVTGYNIYFDMDGKSEPVTSVWRQTSYVHTGLKNGQEYCFKITTLHTDCESGFSNVVCAVPAAKEPQK
jgi:hypothetical protein